MLTRESAELILTEHAAGTSIRAIAKTHGHSPRIVGKYVHGRRVPGEVYTAPDALAPFTAYCRQRLADDPHLRAVTLLAEINALGYPGNRRRLYRGVARHQIQVHPCPDCRALSIKYIQPLPDWQPPPSPLPVPAVPVTGETLASFLGRLAAANCTSTGDLLTVLPPWIRVRSRWHDDRWQQASLAPLADDAAAQLAAISQSAPAAIKNSLPAFGRDAGQPVRAVTACSLCAAARGARHPVPVHLPAWQQTCLKHGIWLPSPGTPQFSVSDCPDILAAQRHARRLANRFTAQRLIYAMVREQAVPGQAQHHRAAALAKANPTLRTGPGPRELARAAAYPDVIAAAAASLRGTG